MKKTYYSPSDLILSTFIKSIYSMKLTLLLKPFFLVLLCIFSFGNIYSQSTVGTGQTYTTLKAAFTAINNGTLTGAVVLQINANSTETASATLNSSGTGAANYTSVSIYPTGGTRTISLNLNDALVELKGADNVTIDGRLNGNGAVNSLIIDNPNTGQWANALTLSTGATNNIIQYTTFKGSSYTSAVFPASPTLGQVINIGDFASGINSGNIIRYNDITKSSGGTPGYGLYSSSSAITNNSGTTLSGNHFYDLGRDSWVRLYGSGGATNGNWVITGNSFYQTSSISISTDYYNDIVFLELGLSSDGANVNGNYFGGTAASAGGTKFTLSLSSSTATSQGLSCIESTSDGLITIEQNVFSNFQIDAHVSSPFTCISAKGSARYIIGSVGKGNVFGSQTVASDISITGALAGQSPNTKLIYYYSTSTTSSIAYNKFAGINMTHTLASGTNSPEFMAIHIYNVGAAAINNNTFGTLAANIKLQGTALGIHYKVINWETDYDAIINDNVFQNFDIKTITSGGTTSQWLVYVNGYGSHQIYNNTFGNATDIDNMSFNTFDYASAIGAMSGGSVSATNYSIHNNSIQNFTQLGTDTYSSLLLIEIGDYSDFSSTSVISVYSNTLTNCKTAGTLSYGAGSFTGIGVKTGSTMSGVPNIHDNEIYAITASGNGLLNGIHYEREGGVLIQNNNIHNLTLSSSGTAGGIRPIHIDEGTSPSATADIQILSNTINTITSNSTNTSTISGAFAGVFFDPGSSLTSVAKITGNTINTVTIQNAGLAYGIMIASGSVTASGNTIQNFSGVSSASGGSILAFSLKSIGLGFGAANVIKITGNTIQNITTASTNTSQGAFSGFYSNPSITFSTPVLFSENSIQDISLSGAGVCSGAYLTGNGNATIQKNLIQRMSVVSSSSSAWLVGILISSTNQANVYNNIVLLDNGINSPTFRGIMDNSNSTKAVNIYHNTVKLFGTATTGTNNSNAFAFLGSTGTPNVRNNVFQNNRTNSGGTASHIAVRYSGAPSGTFDYNWMEASGSSGAVLSNWNAVNKTTLAAFQGASSQAANCKTGTITIDATGHVTNYNKNNVQSTGDNLQATVPDDYSTLLIRPTCPWMGAFEGIPYIPVFTVTITPVTPICSGQTATFNVSVIDDLSAALPCYLIYTIDGGAEQTTLTDALGLLAITKANATSNVVLVVNAIKIGACRYDLSPVQSSTVIVNSSTSIALTSAVGTNAQTVCLTSPITNITYATIGATGATFSGLPTGVIGNWAANVITISGTPTSTLPVIYKYTVTLSGGCTALTALGTINVMPQTTSNIASVTPFCLGGNVTLSASVNAPVTINSAFLNTSTTAIPDNLVGAGWNGSTGTYATSNLTVSGLQTGWSLSSLVLNVSHPNDQDLIAYLFNPCNQSIQLLNANGSTGDNFVNTTYTSTASTLMSAGSAPFTGNFIPSGTASAFATFMTNSQACASANGTWSIRIGDSFTGNTGTIDSWTLNFNNPIATTYTWSPTADMTAGSSTLTPTLTPVAAGTTSYTFTTTNAFSCSNTSTVNVQTLPLPTVPAITGTTNVCMGATTTLANATTGGVWSSASTGVATINALTGVVTPVSAGTSLISYAVTSGGCTKTVTTTVTVYSLPIVGAITGTLSVCPASSTTLGNSTSGGVWNSASTGIASVNSSSGVVLGITNGTSLINYVVTVLGCSTTVSATVTVLPINSVSLTSAAGTDLQTICVNTPITTITYSTIGATGASVSGLPLGFTSGWNANVFTITGTPTVAGSYPYIVTLTGGCGTITTGGTINVTALNTIVLTSAGGTNNQTKCINTSITDIAYSTTGVLGATDSGLPSGVSGSWSGNVYTITGSPSVSVGSPYTYIVTLTGGCGNITATGTITVTPNNTFSLTSAAGTDNQTKCINTLITPITYSTTGAIGGSDSGLPAGVTGSWSSSVYTISGSPSVSGSFPYTITLTGGCGTVTINGTINVTPLNTITLTSLLGTDNQTKCINTPITNITYSTTGVLGATDSGLPLGVTGSWLGNIYTISGSPSVSVASPYSYTITLTGGCGNISTIGSIAVTPDNTINLSSALGTDTQTKCINTLITPITYSTTGAIGGSDSGLPAGVSGSWSGNVYTITGTPTVSGSFPYTITLTGGCGTITKTGTITVTPDKTITLTSAIGTDIQTVCVNNILTNITYSTTGATSATFGGLPSGVTGTWLADAITISGTPVVAGNYPYTITLNGGCGSLSVTGSGTIITGNTIALSSLAGTDSQTPCINTAITPITYSTTGATGANFTNIPAGLSAIWALNVITISGTPTVAGAYTYTVDLTGGCGVVSKSGTMGVILDNTITQSSLVGTEVQTKCINSAITPITYVTSGAIGATFSGLPAGVNGTWSSNIVTISGTPNVSGHFAYTVTLTGGCGNISTSGTIDVTLDNTITLTSGVSSNNPTICLASALTDITFTTTGAVTSVTISGLPAGVTYSYVGNLVTITGTPTGSGSFPYSVSMIGGCGSNTASGIITVTPTSILNFTSAFGTNAQTKCINTSITNITYTVSGATGVTDSGLPAGVTGNLSGGIYTISGTSLVSGTFNYTLTLTGGCGVVNASGSIIVTPLNTITLSSIVGSDNQAICVTDAISPITYNISGAVTSANVTGLPTGITSSLSGNTLTVSGTTSLLDGGTYTIVLIGGCSIPSVNGTITINAVPTLTITSPAAACQPAMVDLTNASVTLGSSSGSILSYWEDATCNLTPIADETAVPLSGTYYIKSTIGTCFVIEPVTVAVNDCSCPVSLAVTNPLAVCAPATVNLTSAFNQTGAETGVISYWNEIGCTTPVIGETAITTSGIYFIKTVSVTACSDVKPVTVVIKPINTITAPLVAGTNNQNLCINNPITTISYTTAHATGATFTGLPTGVTGSFGFNTVTISGTPSVAGNYSYTVTLTGGCGNIQAFGTIDVTPNNTISLSSLVGTDNTQTICVNSPLTAITYATTGATSLTATGLPLGISASLSGNVVTISGSTAIIGTHNYSLAFTGGCGTITATGTFNVKANNTIVLSSAIGTDAQTVYINTPIVNISYLTSGATGFTVSNLASGIGYVFDLPTNTLTISGTPTVAGLKMYTITMSGGCGAGVITGTIDVLPTNTFILSSITGTDSQITCVSNPITNITYTTSGYTAASFSGLPVGVTGNFTSNTITISGTPIFSGPTSYTISLTGGSGPATINGTIGVSTLNTIALTSGIGSDNPSVCINNSITDITFSTTGASGVTFSSLPSGLNSTWIGNVARIYGIPSVSGSTAYTVTLTGGCGNISAGGTINVSPDNTIVLTSLPATAAQTLCIGTPITNITYTTTGATDRVVTGLPQGLTVSALVGNSFTISGTPTQSGPFSYIISLSGGCGNPTLGGTINVTALNTIALTSALGSDNQSICVTNPAIDVTYSTTGATNAVFFGVPLGMTQNFNVVTGVITISGTPANSGLNTYSIALQGGCGLVTTGGRIDIVTVNALNITSLGGTDNQTVCMNVPISNITYSTSGATGASFSGLPAGVNGNWSNNIVTISGTPSVSSLLPYNYTVTTIGGCGSASLSGMITSTPLNTITLTSALSSNRPTPCINTSISNITYNTSGATGATFFGLPAGVIGSWSGGVVTISGAPTVSVNQNYTITLTGGCGSISELGSFNVIPNNTITLSSNVGTDAQAVCPNTQITPIVYTTTGVSAATITVLPAGLSGSWSNDTYTITGMTNSVGIFPYTVTLTGGCGIITKSGSITVNAKNTITLTSAVGSNAQTPCLSSTISNIFYNTTGATGAIFSGLPSGITGNWNANLITISGAPSIQNNFSYTISLTGGLCATLPVSGTINVNPLPVIAISTYSAEVCEGQQITLNATSNSGVPSWSNGIVNNLPFTALNPGLNSFSVSVTNSTTGCQNSSTANLNIKPKPSKPLVTSFVSYCKGENASTLGYVPVPSGGAGLTPIWYASNSNVPLGSAPSQNTTTPIFTYYSVAQKDILTGCISDTARINVLVKPSVTPMFSPEDLSVCQGKENPVMPLSTINSPIVNGTWTPVSTANPGLISTTFTPINEAGSCVVDTTITVPIHPKPVAAFIATPQEFSNISPITSFPNSSIGAEFYIWDFGDGSTDYLSINPTHIYPSDSYGKHEVILIAISDFGCKDTAIRYVFEKEELLYFVPNSFTPDGIGSNEIFQPIFGSGVSPKEYSFLIFNRWGDVIFETNDLNEGWNGKLNSSGEQAFSGSYVWKIKFLTKEDESQIIKTGNVNLLR